MSPTNRVVVLGRGPYRAAAAAAFLQGPGVTLISETNRSDGDWTVMMRDLHRLQVDLTRFRPGNDVDEIPLARCVSHEPVISTDVLLADMSLPPEVVRAALYHARGKVILEPGPAASWVSTFAPFVHLLVPSVEMLDVLTEAPAGSEPAVQAQELAQRLRVTVIVPLDPTTSLLVRHDQTTTVISAPVEGSVVASPKADDCFRGVLAAQLASKTPLPDAVRTATAASALWASGALLDWPTPRDIDSVSVL